MTQQRDNRLKINEQSPRDLYDYYRTCNICVLGVPEKTDKDNGALKKYLKKQGKQWLKNFQA